MFSKVWLIKSLFKANWFAGMFSSRRACASIVSSISSAGQTCETRPSTGLRALPDLHEAFDVVPHELEIANGIPCTGPRLRARGVVGAPPTVLDLRPATGIEIVSARQRAARAAKHDRTDGTRRGRAVDRVCHALNDPLGQRVHLARTVERDDRHAAPLFIENDGFTHRSDLLASELRLGATRPLNPA